MKILKKNMNGAFMLSSINMKKNRFNKYLYKEQQKRQASVSAVTGFGSFQLMIFSFSLHLT
jgi:hypothetical protein